MARLESWIDKNIKALHKRYYDAYFHTSSTQCSQQCWLNHPSEIRKYATAAAQRQRLKRALLDRADEILNKRHTSIR